MDTIYIETWLKDVAFKGLTRKDNTTPMAQHSINVGRGLKEKGYDDLTVFTGYFHDVVEDCKENFPNMDIQNIVLAQARLFFDEENSQLALTMVNDCSYSEDEYEQEKSIVALTGDKDEGKKIRKQNATARWLLCDRRVRCVKEEDVTDNENSALAVSQDFYNAYIKWALPFKEELIAIRTLEEMQPITI